MVNSFAQTIPRPYRRNIMNNITYTIKIFATFLRGQMMVSLMLMLIYTAILTIIGLKNGLIIGFITGVISFYPIFGIYYRIGNCHDYCIDRLA